MPSCISDSDRHFRCILVNSHKCLAKCMNHRSDMIPCRSLKTSSSRHQNQSTPRRCLPELQVVPFHPVLHVHVFGLEQLPLTHDGEQIAADDSVSRQGKKIFNLRVLHVELDHPASHLSTNIVKSRSLMMLGMVTHVHTSGTVQLPLAHDGEHTASERSENRPSNKQWCSHTCCTSRSRIASCTLTHVARCTIATIRTRRLTSRTCNDQSDYTTDDRDSLLEVLELFVLRERVNATVVAIPTVRRATIHSSRERNTWRRVLRDSFDLRVLKRTLWTDVCSDDEMSTHQFLNLDWHSLM